MNTPISLHPSGGSVVESVGPSAGRNEEKQPAASRRRRASGSGEVRNKKLPKVRLTDAELASIQAAAAQAGMAAAAWAGEILLYAAKVGDGRTPVGADDGDDDPAGLGQLERDPSPWAKAQMRELIKTQARVGNNINQIVREWNKGEVLAPAQAAMGERLYRQMGELIAATNAANAALRGRR